MLPTSAILCKYSVWMFCACGVVTDSKRQERGKQNIFVEHYFTVFLVFFPQLYQSHRVIFLLLTPFYFVHEDMTLPLFHSEESPKACTHHWHTQTLALFLVLLSAPHLLTSGLSWPWLLASLGLGLWNRRNVHKM
jgi:hypothetical protein